MVQHLAGMRLRRLGSGGGLPVAYSIASYTSVEKSVNTFGGSGESIMRKRILGVRGKCSLVFRVSLSLIRYLALDLFRRLTRLLRNQP